MTAVTNDNCYIESKAHSTGTWAVWQLSLFLFEMAPATLVALEANFTQAVGTNTVATVITNPPGPTLIKAFSAILTRNPHKRC